MDEFLKYGLFGVAFLFFLWLAKTFVSLWLHAGQSVSGKAPLFVKVGAVLSCLALVGSVFGVFYQNPSLLRSVWPGEAPVEVAARSPGSPSEPVDPASPDPEVGAADSNSTRSTLDQRDPPPKRDDDPPPPPEPERLYVLAGSYQEWRDVRRIELSTSMQSILDVSASMISEVDFKRRINAIDASTLQGLSIVRCPSNSKAPTALQSGVCLEEKAANDIYKFGEDFYLASDGFQGGNTWVRVLQQ